MATGVAEAAAARALAQLGCSGGGLGIGGEPANANSVRRPDVQEDSGEQHEEERPNSGSDGSLKVSSGGAAAPSMAKL